MQYYQIVKYYENPNQMPRVHRGYGRLTIDEARKICSDPETSSKTASTACNGNEKTIATWHKKQKHWFLGFRAI